MSYKCRGFIFLIFFLIFFDFDNFEINDGTVLNEELDQYINKIKGYLS